MRKSIRFLFPIASILLLFWIEQGQNAPYIVKTVAKVALFLIIPCFLFRKTTFSFLRFHKIDKRSLQVALISGVMVMTIIIVAFILFHPFIDIDSLLFDLGEAGVTATVFPFVALYILFWQFVT